MQKLLALSIALATPFLAGTASAQWVFDANLLGSNEVSPTSSPGTGFGQVVLSLDQAHITVDESWSGLTAPATASHIHGPADTLHNAPVLFPLSGVPAATSGSIPTQTFAITPLEVSDLFAGLLYLNIHTSTFPGGEIRGQLTLVPEPGTAALFALGAAALLARRRIA